MPVLPSNSSLQPSTDATADGHLVRPGHVTTILVGDLQAILFPLPPDQRVHLHVHGDQLYLRAGKDSYRLAASFAPSQM